MKPPKKSTILSFFGIGSLILAVINPTELADAGNLFIFAVIFMTGAMITSSIEDHKCHT